MTRKQTSPAKKTYCVWADRVTRVCQAVEAETPEQAYDLAWERPECWRHSDGREARDEYRLSNDVQLEGTGDYFTVVDVEHCETCGSEIEETINESNFGDGECGPCEYGRYKSQPELLTAAEDALEDLKAWKAAVGTEECPETDETILKLERAIAATRTTAA